MSRIRGPYVRFCERDGARRLILLDVSAFYSSLKKGKKKQPNGEVAAIAKGNTVDRLS